MHAPLTPPQSRTQFDLASAVVRSRAKAAARAAQQLAVASARADDRTTTHYVLRVLVAHLEQLAAPVKKTPAQKLPRR